MPGILIETRDHRKAPDRSGVSAQAPRFEINTGPHFRTRWLLLLHRCEFMDGREPNVSQDGPLSGNSSGEENMNIASLLTAAAHERPDHPAFRFEGRVVTYRGSNT